MASPRSWVVQRCGKRPKYAKNSIYHEITLFIFGKNYFKKEKNGVRGHGLDLGFEWFRELERNLNMLKTAFITSHLVYFWKKLILKRKKGQDAWFDLGLSAKFL